MGTNIEGVVDKRIGMLAIKDAETKELTGIIVFCTAHPNVLKVIVMHYQQTIRG